MAFASGALGSQVQVFCVAREKRSCAAGLPSAPTQSRPFRGGRVARSAIRDQVGRRCAPRHHSRPSWTVGICVARVGRQARLAASTRYTIVLRRIAGDRRGARRGDGESRDAVGGPCLIGHPFGDYAHTHRTSGGAWCHWHAGLTPAHPPNTTTVTLGTQRVNEKVRDSWDVRHCTREAMIRRTHHCGHRSPAGSHW